MSKLFKRIIALPCVVCLLITMLSGFASAEEDESVYVNDAGNAAALLSSGEYDIVYTDIPIYVDGEQMSCGYKINTTTYVSILDFCEAIGVDMEPGWDPETETAFVSTDGLSLSVRVGDYYLTANNRCLYLPEGVYNLDGTVLVPLRELAKCFGAEVTWNAENWSVEIIADEISYIENGEEFYDTEDLYWLSRIVNAEAGNQELEGMIGVGNVVLNRVEDPTCPDTVYDVIFDTRFGVQFSPTETGTIYNEPCELAEVAAKLCLEGYELVGASLFFVNPEIGVTGWFANTRTYIATIGDHAFYA